MLTAVYLPISDSEGFSGTDSICGTDSEDAASSESLPGYETPMPNEPSGTESDSSFEYSTSSDDSEERLSDLLW